MNIRILLLILLCAGSSLRAQENDPFDKSRRRPAVSTEHTENQLPATQCKLQRRVLAAELPFERLRIVGILRHREERQVLFADEEQRVFAAVVGQPVAQERWEIGRIDNREIQLFGRQADCSVGETITVKF